MTDGESFFARPSDDQASPLAAQYSPGQVQGGYQQVDDQSGYSVTAADEPYRDQASSYGEYDQPTHARSAYFEPTVSQQTVSQPGYRQPASYSHPATYAQPPYSQPAYADFPVASVDSTYAGGYPSGYAQASYAAYPPNLYGYAHQGLEHPQAGTVLVLGILSLFFNLAAPFAWILGSRARRDIREHPDLYRESASLTVGWVIGIVVTVAMVVVLGLLTLALLGVFG